MKKPKDEKPLDVILPHSVEAEASIIGCMILHNECIPRVAATIEEDAFFLETNKEVYKAIISGYSQKNIIDLVILKDSLGDKLIGMGGPERLVYYVENTPNPGNWKAYLNIVESKWRMREAYVKAKEITDIAVKGGNLEEVWELADGIKSVRRMADGHKNIKDSAEASLASLEEIRKVGVDLKIGLAGIDANIGSVRRKQLYIIGAKTSNGKTSLALNIGANNMIDKKKVLFASFENVDQVPTRTASILSGVPLDFYLKPNLCTEEEYKAVRDSMEMLKDMRDLMIVMNGPSVVQMRAMCDEFKPDIVFVDYIQRYAHKYALGTKENLSHQIGKVASDLADLSIDKNCAVFALSQLSRRTEEHRNRKPVITDLKESGDLENYADCIMLPWWPWRDDPTGGKDPQEYYIIVAKNKLGPCMDHCQKVNVQTLEITDWGIKEGI